MILQAQGDEDDEDEPFAMDIPEGYMNEFFQEVSSSLHLNLYHCFSCWAILFSTQALNLVFLFNCVVHLWMELKGR